MMTLFMKKYPFLLVIFSFPFVVISLGCDFGDFYEDKIVYTKRDCPNIFLEFQKIPGGGQDCKTVYDNYPSTGLDCINLTGGATFWKSPANGIVLKKELVPDLDPSRARWVLCANDKTPLQFTPRTSQLGYNEKFLHHEEEDVSNVIFATIIRLIFIADYTNINITVLPPENETTVIIEDTEFANGDWEHLELLDSNNNSVDLPVVEQQLTGGNPGAYQQGIHDYGPGSVGYGHIYNRNFYDLRQGAIISLDFEYDFIVWEIITNDRVTRGGVASYPLLEQNGIYFLAGGFWLTPIIDPFIIPNILPTWTFRQADNPNTGTMGEPLAVGLTSEDFTPVDPAAASPIEHPDFSASGGVIQFGYYSRNASGGIGFNTWGIDNWRVTIHHEAP